MNTFIERLKLGQHVTGKAKLRFALYVAVVSTVSATAQPLITFDDLPAGMVDGFQITNGYGGLNWNNFNVNNDGYELPFAPNGYLAGIVSLHNYAFNSYANPASITSGSTFDLGSGYFTAAWRDNLNLKVQGYNGATLVYDRTYILSATAPSLIILNFDNVTAVNFTSFGGIQHPGYVSGNGAHFLVDNLQIGLVPEPCASSLCLIGAGCCWLWGRNRSQTRPPELAHAQHS